jgi:dTDP-4-amino-4,6-dideoxygalactose transaminase
VKRVPFVDLGAGTRPLREQLLAAVAGVLDSGAWVGGPAVAGFEKAFAAFCETSDAAAVGTGTDALLLALRALGVGPGDEVITATNSFFATGEAIALAGAKPVFADVDDSTLLIDPADVARKLTDRTRAIIPVHLYGQPADMDALGKLGKPLLEDSCQAHGARLHGKRAGSLGVAAAFSFYPTKNLGAIGEGGAITSSDAGLMARVRKLRDHGQKDKHVHEEVAYNARLDALQCAMLTVKLAHLDAWCHARRQLAARYRTELARVPGVRLLAERHGAEGVYHLMIVRVAQRDRVRARLGELGIDTAIHYPTPMHLQPAFASLGQTIGSLPVAERAAGEILSLPMYPEMAMGDVDRVCSALADAMKAA